MIEDEFDIPELTIQIVSRSRVIVPGSKIQDMDRLLRTYGGTKKLWKKKSSPPLEIHGRSAEIHWYEHPGIGVVEKKIKWLE